MEKYSFEEVVEEVKRILVELIIESLRMNKIDVESSRKLAADFLEMLPMKDKEDLLEKLRILGQTHRLALQVYDEFSVKDLKLESTSKRLYEETDLPKNGT